MSICEQVRLRLKVDLDEPDHPYAKHVQKSIDMQMESLVRQQPGIRGGYSPYLGLQASLIQCSGHNKFDVYQRYMLSVANIIKANTTDGVRVSAVIDRHKWRKPHTVILDRQAFMYGPEVVSVKMYKNIRGRRTNLRNGYIDCFDSVYVVGERNKVNKVVKRIRALSKLNYFTGKNLSSTDMKQLLGDDCFLFITIDEPHGSYTVLRNGCQAATSNAERTGKGYQLGELHFPALSKDMKLAEFLDIPRLHPIQNELT